MKALTISGWALALIGALLVTEASACCGLGGGIGIGGSGTHLIPVLMGSALILWPLHVGYSRLVKVPVSWLGSLASSATYVFGAALSISLSVMLDRQSGVLMTVAVLLFLIIYGILYRFVHRATILKGLGFAILGLPAYLTAFVVSASLLEMIVESLS